MSKRTERIAKAKARPVEETEALRHQERTRFSTTWRPAELFERRAKKPRKPESPSKQRRRERRAGMMAGLRKAR